jgi:hypothetical protein
MKDCYGEMVVIEAGDSIEIETQAMEPVGTRLRYRLEYQTIAEEVLYTVESNEFEVR